MRYFRYEILSAAGWILININMLKYNYISFLAAFREFDSVLRLFFLFKIDIRIEHEKLHQTTNMPVWSPGTLRY